jgi:hypothetical protein
MNATEGISIYSNKGLGLIRNFYVDTNGKIQGKSLEIDDESIFFGKVAVTNGYTDIIIDPDGLIPFKINYLSRDIFTVDTSGNANLNQVTLRNDLIGSNYFKISTDGMFSWDNSLSLKTFEIDSSGKAYFRGDITSNATITGATIRSGALGTDRIELSSGKFRGLTASDQITGLYFDISTIPGTGIADVFLYHNNTKLVEFYDNISSYAIRGTTSSTGLSLGGIYATTYAEGDWDFTMSTIYNLVTGNAGSHSHGGSTGGGGSHSHTVVVDGVSYGTSSDGSHSHYIAGDGSHSHTVQSS